jgi:hypothetical protein
MDCNSARLYLQFVRPGEAEELDEHLAHCSECNSLALANDRLDQHLGRAMLAVEVPRGLKGQILQRVAAERPRWYRRFHGPGGILAAAVLLAMLGAGILFYKPARTSIELDQVLAGFNISRPGEDGANYQLQKLAAGRKVPRNCAPDFVKYKYLVGMPSLAILPGTEDKVVVPQFVFSHPTKGHRAVVFVLPRKGYEVEPLTSSGHGYTFGLDPDARPEGAFIYLVFHTGKDWRWLEEPKSE